MWGKNVARKYPGDLGPCVSFSRWAPTARIAEAPKTEADVSRSCEMHLLIIGGKLVPSGLQQRLYNPAHTAGTSDVARNCTYLVTAGCVLDESSLRAAMQVYPWSKYRGDDLYG